MRGDVVERQPALSFGRTPSPTVSSRPSGRRRPGRWPGARRGRIAGVISAPISSLSPISLAAAWARTTPARLLRSVMASAAYPARRPAPTSSSGCEAPEEREVRLAVQLGIAPVDSAAVKGCGCKGLDRAFIELPCRNQPSRPEQPQAAVVRLHLEIVPSDLCPRHQPVSIRSGPQATGDDVLFGNPVQLDWPTCRISQHVDRLRTVQSQRAENAQSPPWLNRQVFRRRSRTDRQIRAGHRELFVAA